MFKLPRLIWQDDFSRRGTATAIFFWLAGLFLLVFFWSKLPPQIPLFYSLPWGEEQLASPVSVLILPGGIFLIILFNFLTAIFLASENLILRTVSLVSAICSFLCLFAIVKILELVI